MTIRLIDNADGTVIGDLAGGTPDIVGDDGVTVIGEVRTVGVMHGGASGPQLWISGEIQGRSFSTYLPILDPQAILNEQMSR